MAHFAIVFGKPDRIGQTKELARETQDAILAAGHSCSVWSFWEPVCKIKQFVETALSVEGPVCIGYTGHGLPPGWLCGGKEKIYSYRVLGKAVARRKGIPTAIIGDCCHAGSIVEGFSGFGFDRLNTIALTASSGGRISLGTPELSKNHTGRVFKAWFEERKPFNPFDHDDHCIMDGGGNPREWEKWLRLGPERFGSQKIDEHFFGKSS